MTETSIKNTSKDWPTVFIIFGATGDLMSKKIVPALYLLYREKQLPNLFNVIGSARSNLTNIEFRDNIKKILLEKKLFIEGQDDEFLSLFEYQKAEFSNPEDYSLLAKKLGRIDGVWSSCSNKLFYIAVPPQNYELLFNQISASKLSEPCGPDEGWTRVIVEKPFGDDYETAIKLEQLLWKLFDEDQIYRIDHYLAKGMLQNILVFRFANNLLENSWNGQNIESIEINFLETIGAEERGSFYDKVGALKDIGQNHVLQLLALITMENPISFDDKSVRKSRAQILNYLPKLTDDDIRQDTKRYQYKGYENIEGVIKGSDTETYFELNFKLTHPRWKDVNIKARGGKRVKEARKEVIITFKHLESSLKIPGSEDAKNKIIFRVEPTREIVIEFWSKKPGLEMQIQKVDFNFTYKKNDATILYTNEYKKLLYDCMNGNELLFVSSTEIEESWKFIDPIVKAWKNNLVPLQEYEPDTTPE